MKKEEKRNRFILLILSIIFILSGTFLIGIKFVKPIIKEQEEDKALEEFYKNEIIIDKVDKTSSVEEKQEKSKSKLEYVAVLKIPKIKLEKGIVGKNSKYNSVDYGIEVLDSSDTPDAEKGNVILCAHAGNSKVSYFRELDLLKVGDVVMLIYKGKTYQYEIVDIYSIKKTGTAPIRRDRDKSTITLITCIHNTDRQIVLIGNLQSFE
ncbi:MAG: sortase [Bacilli bacterium]|nr:sortase [Bacilli bacterium]